MPPAAADPNPPRPFLVPPDIAEPSTREWLEELRTQRADDRQERQAQTEAFTEALDSLGQRFEKGLGGMRTELRYHSGVVVLALAIVAALAGATVYFKLGGIEVRTEPTAEAAALPTVHAAVAPVAP